MKAIRENRLAALLWRLAGLIIGSYGLILMFRASSVKQQLCYFTNQSNLFVLLLFAGLSVQTVVQIRRDGIHGPVPHAGCGLHLALTLYITITMVCYWALLSWQNFSMAGVKISQFQFHSSHRCPHLRVGRLDSVSAPWAGTSGWRCVFSHLSCGLFRLHHPSGTFWGIPVWNRALPLSICRSGPFGMAARDPDYGLTSEFLLWLGTPFHCHRPAFRQT